MTTYLLGAAAAAAVLDLTPMRLRTLRGYGLFPDPNARIRGWVGWESHRVQRYASEDFERLTERMRQRRGQQRIEPGEQPSWWSADTVRYIGLGELGEAAVLSRSAVWSHYYSGRLPDPDITIGHRNRIAGWTPGNAKDIAAAQGWQFDLARLRDVSGLGAHL